MTMKPVANFPAYRISDIGTLESCWTWGAYYPGMASNPKWKRVPLKPNEDGYIPVHLCAAGGRRRRTHLHRLLVETFISPPPFPKACVRHLDGNPYNNAVENLAWGTYITNAKLTPKGIERAFQLSKNGNPHKAIALKLCVSRPTISRLLGGKTWRQK
jgi:hypothetical protein